MTLITNRHKMYTHTQGKQTKVPNSSMCAYAHIVIFVYRFFS